jgi:DNA polymerase-1
MNAFSDARELRRFLPERDMLRTHRTILGDGDENPDIVIVKYQPHGWDLQASKPLMGKDGIPIRRHLVQEGIKFYATSLFPFSNGTDKAKADDVRKVTPILAEELKRVPCKNYVLLGAEVARHMPGFDHPFKKFSEVAGRVIESGGNRYLLAHAPAAISSNPQVYAQFVDGLKRLLQPVAQPLVKTLFREEYRVVTNAIQARRILDKIPLGANVAVDLETTGLDRWTDRILTIQFAWVEGVGYAFPWDLLTPDEWSKYLTGRRLIFQNGSFDVKFLAVNGVHVQLAEDTMLMHSLLDETPGTHSMEQLSQRYLGIEKWSDTVNYDDMEGNDLQTLGRYGARDTDITLRLANHFRPQLEGRYINTVLHRAQNAIIRSELRGIRIDREKAHQFQEEIQSALHDRKLYLADTYGLQNANSPAQVAKLLVEDMGIPLAKRGKVSTASAIIEPFAEEHPVVRDILEYRHLTKAGSTYVRNILAESERDGRYHPEFKLAATETGRVTEKLITLIPRPDDLKNPDLGKRYQIRLRELFLPDEGMVMIGADFRGLEVGMGALLSYDPQLIADYNADLDTHSVVAIEAFGLPIELEPWATLKKRTQEHHAFEREMAKRGTFTWLYGGTAQTIVRQLGIKRELAEKILETLKARYQGVARWQDSVRETVLRDHHVSTPWGRMRRFFIHPGLDEKLIDDQLREAINAPNQGMSSDVNLSAFAELEARGIQTLFPFHDAVYVQAPEDEAERVAATVKTVMENAIRGPVNFEADVKTGPNWAELG